MRLLYPRLGGGGVIKQYRDPSVRLSVPGAAGLGAQLP